MNDLVATVLLVAGGVFCAVAGIGLLRLPDVLVRMHASTKAGTLGVGLVVIAGALHFAEAVVAVKAILVVVFLLLTAPVGAHLIGRAAYRSGSPLWEGTVIDERERMERGADGGTDPAPDAPPPGGTDAPAAAGATPAAPSGGTTSTRTPPRR